MPEIPENNRFAPPSSAVADVLTPPPGLPPRRVMQAVRLLWISFLLDLPSFIHVFEDAQDASVVVTLVIVTALLVFSAYLIVSIQRGRNWARMAWLALFLLSIAAAVFAPPSDSTTPLEDVCGWVSTVLDVVSMVLLFTRPGSLWFKPVAATSTGATR